MTDDVLSLFKRKKYFENVINIIILNSLNYNE